MDRPPTVSMLFFLAAGAVLAAATFARPGDNSVAPARAEPAMAAGPEARASRIRAFAETWPSAPDFAPAFNALDPSFDIGEASASVFDARDDYFGLPRDEGYELVYGYCGACHSLRIVMEQHATRQRWSELLRWMTEEQGMPAPPSDEKAVLIDYLSRHFGAHG